VIARAVLVRAVGTRGRGWLRRRTLRWRLTAGVVLLLVTMCALVGVVTAVSLRGFLVRRLDSQLTQASGRFSTSLEHGADVAPGGSDGDADNSVPGQSTGTLGARLLNGTVTQAAIVLSDGKNRTLAFSAADQAILAAVPDNGTAQTVGLADLGEYRVLATAGRDGDVQLTGLPLHPLDEIVARLLTIELAAFAVIVLGGAAASALLVRLTLRPLNRVAAAALSVSELPLASGTVDLPDRHLSVEPGTEVGRVGIAFDRMLDHVEVALKARNTTEERLRRFIADASHELRTPLAAIRSYSEFALRGAHDLPESVAQALIRVESESIRMGALVDDLLLLARLDADRPLARDTVDLTRVVLDAMSDARAAGPQHHWRLDLPEQPVELVGDEHRLRQVMANLLANARVHTPAGTTVQLRLWREDGAAAVDISDDGPGIPAALLPELFERFTRADGARSHDGGNTGLGLAIAFGIVQSHRGTLTVVSTDQGARFQIRLALGPH
jgi:two-component system OmpR family sensor kinase